MNNIYYSPYFHFLSEYIKNNFSTITSFTLGFSILNIIVVLEIKSLKILFKRDDKLHLIKRLKVILQKNHKKLELVNTLI